MNSGTGAGAGAPRGGRLFAMLVSVAFILNAFAAVAGYPVGEPPDVSKSVGKVGGLRRTGGLLVPGGPVESATTRIVKPGSISSGQPNLPSAVDNTAGLPPVGDQNGEGSCTAWAIGYYHTTYIECKENGLDPNDQANQTSPSFLYNVANGGEDYGSYMDDVGNLLISGGAPSMAEFPYVNGDYISWPDEDWIWTSGMKRKAVSQNWLDLGQPGGFDDAKAYLAAGNTMTTGIYVWSNFDYIHNFNYTYCSSERYGSNRGGHIVCIAGYDDGFPTADGKGAFRMVNSWGTGWGEAGYWWMSYSAIVDSAIDPGWVMYMESEVKYEPSMVARLQIDHPSRGDIMKGSGLQIALAVNGSAVWSNTYLGPFYMESYMWGTYHQHPFPTGRFSLDISDALPYMSNTVENVFSADITNNEGTDGQLNSMEILCEAWWCGNYSDAAPVLLQAYGWATAPTSVLDGSFSHLPIRVDDDADLRHQAIGEFWTGNGTAWAPYYAHGYDVSGSGYGYCIYVGNTSNHITVSDCDLFDASGASNWPFYSDSGMTLFSVSNGLVAGNEASTNGGAGIFLISSIGNTLANNRASWNHGHGIRLSNDSDGNVLAGNNASSNNWRGIWLDRSGGNVIANCTALGNGVSLNGGWGIYLGNSGHNTICDNNASSNAWYNIYLGSSGNNTVYHNNFIGSLYQAFDNGSANVWNDSYPSGGNYWSDCTSPDMMSGPSQSIPGSDGIGDTPYVIDSDSSDRYPLMTPWVPIPADTSPPVHSLESPGINGRSANLTPVISVHVTDMSGVVASSIRLYVNGFRVFNDLGAIAEGYNVSYWQDMGFRPGRNVSCRIVAEDLLGHRLDYTWNFTTPPSFSIPVHLGWNLISMPLVKGSGLLPSCLIDLGSDTLWDRAMWYDAADAANRWKQYGKAWSASINDLKSVTVAMGLWVNVTNLGDGLIEVWGEEPSTTAIVLRAGWNMVGYPTLTTNMTVANAFWGTGANIVEAFDPAMPYRTKVVAPTYVMKPGEGYWVHVPADTVWTVNW